MIVLICTTMHWDTYISRKAPPFKVGRAVYAVTQQLIERVEEFPIDEVPNTLHNAARQPGYISL
ncbi:MAG: hypothetical protein ACRED0_02385 [Gammaproteobacteria bacterium]